MSSSVRKRELAAERKLAEDIAERDRQAKAERYRYLPASYRSFDELIACVGEGTANAIKEYITDLIDEHACDRRGDE